MDSIRSALDWGSLAPLRLKARQVADGVYAGNHRSLRRGSGIEFGGHRSYVPGDDLRWLDHRALMRHGKLLVREFETETDRALRLVIDASASMGYRGPNAPGAKLAYAGLIAAAMSRIALASGDPVALDWIGGTAARRLPATGGREAFERLLGTLESVEPSGDLSESLSDVELALAPIARHARKGAVVILLSDLIDLPKGSIDRFTALGARGRTLVVVQVLDPAEAEFPFEGPVRLRAVEGSGFVETDARAAREGYLARVGQITSAWEDNLVARGGRLVKATSASDATEVVRAILLATEGKAA